MEEEEGEDDRIWDVYLHGEKEWYLEKIEVDFSIRVMDFIAWHVFVCLFFPNVKTQRGNRENHYISVKLEKQDFVIPLDIVSFISLDCNGGIIK